MLECVLTEYFILTDYYVSYKAKRVKIRNNFSYQWSKNRAMSYSCKFSEPINSNKDLFINPVQFHVPFSHFLLNACFIASIMNFLNNNKKPSQHASVSTFQCTLHLHLVAPREDIQQCKYSV